MKQLKILFALVFAALLIALLFWLLSPRSNSYAPRYIVLTNQPVVTATMQGYLWYDPVVFRDGRFWVTLVTVTGTNSHLNYYLYDLQKRRPVAELTNGYPILFGSDGTKLLCSGYGPPTLAEKGSSILSRVSGGRIDLESSFYHEHFWILDLRKNTALDIGSFLEFSGSSSFSRWIAAPGFRYAYICPNSIRAGEGFYLCDLEQQVLKKVDFNGELLGWWNHHQILFMDGARAFFAYDVQTGQSTNVLAPDGLRQILARFNLTNDPTGVAATPEWNGSNYNWYFSGDRTNGLDTNSTFLLQAEQEGPTFKLVKRDFQFHLQGHFDQSGASYFYPGELGGPRSGSDGSVRLMNLSNNSTRIIVPPGSTNQYPLARLTGDTLIYISNRVLWRASLTTTNAEPLFPAPPQK